jgi:hypothetical protein
MLNLVRAGSAYPKLRKSIAVTRAVALVLVILLFAVAVLGFVGMILVALLATGGSPYALIPALLTTVISALIWCGIVYLAAELICGSLEVLTDLGDQAIGNSIDKDAARRADADRATEVGVAMDPPKVQQPFVAVPSMVMPADPPAQQSDRPTSSPSALDDSLGPTVAERAAARKLLELARKHASNGNKPEAVRCLRELIGRYGTTEAADSARRALDRIVR